MNTAKNSRLWPATMGSLLAGVVKAGRQAPATWLLLLLLWVPGLLTGTVISGHREALPSAIVASPASLPGQWWTILTAPLWERGLGGYLAGTVLLLVSGLPAERRLGSLRFLIAGFTAQAAGIVLAIGMVHGIHSLLGSWSAQLLLQSYVGPSAIVFGAALAATTTLGVLWRRRLRLTLFTLLTLLALYSGSFPDLIRLAAATVGVFLGPLLFARVPRVSAPVASRREARVLVALIVAASAVGPVVAGLLPHAVGPLSVLRYLFTNIQTVDPQTLQALCTDPTQVKDCAEAQLQLRAGAGGIFMSILPSVLLLIVADGLRRGRRFAWYAALAIQGGLAILAGSYIGAALMPASPGTSPKDGWGAVDITPQYHPLSLILPLLLPVVLVVLLLVTRKLFRISAPPRTYRTLSLTVMVTAVCLAVIYVLLGLALAEGFTPADLEQLVTRTGFSRFPIADNTGDVLGYVHLKDVLYAGTQRRDEPLARFRYRPLAVSAQSDEIEESLVAMQHSGAHLARVMEGEDMVGVVFLEDIIEELVGEVRDSMQRDNWS